MIMCIVVTLGLVSCTPFSVNKYLEKVSESKNFTMEYEWNLSGRFTRDIYEFDDGKLRRLSGTEVVTERNSDGQYNIYQYLYNVWFRYEPMDEKAYLESIGFGEHGGGFGEEFDKNDPEKQTGINLSNKVLLLAQESLNDAFDMGTNSHTLKKEYYVDIFGSKFEDNSSVDIKLEGGKIILSVEYGNSSFVQTISKLGSTKVKITDEMRDGKLMI